MFDRGSVEAGPAQEPVTSALDQCPLRSKVSLKTTSQDLIFVSCCSQVEFTGAALPSTRPLHAFCSNLSATGPGIRCVLSINSENAPGSRSGAPFQVPHLHLAKSRLVSS